MGCFDPVAMWRTAPARSRLLWVGAGKVPAADGSGSRSPGPGGVRLARPSAQGAQLAKPGTSRPPRQDKRLHGAYPAKAVGQGLVWRETHTAARGIRRWRPPNVPPRRNPSLAAPKKNVPPRRDPSLAAPTRPSPAASAMHYAANRPQPRSVDHVSMVGMLTWLAGGPAGDFAALYRCAVRSGAVATCAVRSGAAGVSRPLRARSDLCRPLRGRSDLCRPPPDRRKPRATSTDFRPPPRAPRRPTPTPPLRPPPPARTSPARRRR